MEMDYLLRACSYCKDIYNEKKDLWEQNTGLYNAMYEKKKITHGICPGCLEEKLIELEEEQND